MKSASGYFRKLTIKNKISMFTGAVFLVIIMAVMITALLIKSLVMDFNDILEDNAASVQIVSALEAETDAFQEYIRRPTDVNLESLNDCMKSSKDAIYSISESYGYLGEKRFAQLQSIKSSYEVYSNSRDGVLETDISNKQNISKIYTVYDMQDYLQQYAQTFMFTTLEEGNNRYSQVLPTAMRLPIIAIVTGVILFAVIIQLSKMLNDTIVGPVLKLSNASRRIAANDFSVEDITAENDDEIGDLIKAFNKMKYATSEYIRALEERKEALDQLHDQEIRNLETQKQIETMNLALLKSQINPHFLFNTLNVISGMANLEDAHTTEKMTGALSSLFRYNLKMQDAEAILNQEIKAATDYMYLQQMRFGNRLIFDIDCQVDADKVMVPTFTLQPLLENSVIHGITPKIEGGSVRLSIKKQEGMLCIVVSDTGVGIEGEKLKELRHALKNSEFDKVGIGVGNIYRRIYSMYDDKNMEIDSAYGQWTRITVLIPYHTQISIE